MRVRVRVRVRLRLKKGPLGWLCRFRNTLMPLSVKITYINQSLDVWMATVREATDVCIDSVVSVGSILSKHLLAFWFLTAATECIGL